MKISMKKRKIGYVYSSVSGRFPFRGEKNICFESKLEESFLTGMAFNDGVLDIEEQPFTLEYETSEGKTATYTPDFLVHFRYLSPDYSKKVSFSKSLLVEVKPRKILQKRFCEFLPKFKAAISYSRDNDMMFKIYDESRIYTPYYKNIVFLQRYSRSEYDPYIEKRIMQYLEIMGSATIDNILAVQCNTEVERGLMLGQIWHLLSVKKLSAVLDWPLGYETDVWINKPYKEEGL